MSTPHLGDPTRRAFACLIVEDDPAFASMAAALVGEAGGAATVCTSVMEARQADAARAFDLVLLDNHLPDGRGCDLFGHLSRRDPERPVVMITGAPDLTDAVGLTRNGLFDYLTKPVRRDALLACLERACLRLRSRATPATVEFVGDAPSMLEVRQQLEQAARHPASTVLITGETGTGKDVAARYLHALAPGNATRPFIPVNCAAVPPEMFEAELFGAERGAYTGADRRRTGLATAAAGGTLFLDEIGEVPLAQQPKLLRFVEAREFRPLGSTESQPFTGRFVAATNRILSEEVRAGRFREDLWYRLDVLSVELPPLRRRRSDIPMLAERLLAGLAAKYERPTPLVAPEDLARLQAHDFPGNVRELRNVLERSLLRTTASSRWLSIDPAWLRQADNPPPVQAVVPESAPAPCERDLTPLEAQEYRLIRDTLATNQGGIRRTAARLGMSPQALLRRLEKWPELRGGRS